MLGTLLGLVLATACVPTKPEVDIGSRLPSKRPTDPPRVYPIETDNQLLRGEQATGRKGDIRVENEEIVLVIAAPGKDRDNGGHIIDAALQTTGADELDAFLAYANSQLRRRATYSSMRIIDEGRSGRAAIVEVTGTDSGDPNLQVTTRYILPKTGRVVAIKTEILNSGKTDYVGFELRDTVRWGQTRAFAPGMGFALSAVDEPVNWIAAQGRLASYGWFGDDFQKKMRVRSGGQWTDGLFDITSLYPGWKGNYERYFAVGDGTVGSLMGPLLTTQKLPKTAIAGSVVEQQSNKPVPEASIRVLKVDPDGNKVPFVVFRTGPRGSFSGAIPPGKYEAEIVAPGRRAVGGPYAFSSASKEVALKVVVSPACSVTFNVSDGKSPIPARLTFLGVDGTADPLVGARPNTAAHSNKLFAAAGRGAASLPPGKYKVQITAGPEYEMVEQQIEVKANEVSPVTAVLARAVDTTGWMAADLNQATTATPECATSPEERVAANLAEGIEIAVTSDHRTVTRLDELVEKSGAAARLKTIPGIEIDTDDIGHFTVFPVEPSGDWKPWPLSPGDDPEGVFRLARAASGGDKVIQVNHPRAGNLGYFDNMFLDFDDPEATSGRMSWGFDTVEIANGARLDELERNLDAWYGTLHDGRPVVGVGNSDSCGLDKPPGYPRTWLKLNTDSTADVTPAGVVGALTITRGVVVSNGPFVEVELAGTPIGGTYPVKPGRRAPMKVKVTAPTWMTIDQVEIIRSGKVVKVWNRLNRTKKAVRLDAEHRVWVGVPNWFVVRVSGKTPMEPLSKQTPFAITNPIFVVGPTGIEPLPKGARKRPAATKATGTKARTPAKAKPADGAKKPADKGKKPTDKGKKPAGGEDLPPWLQ